MICSGVTRSRVYLVYLVSTCCLFLINTVPWEKSSLWKWTSKFPFVAAKAHLHPCSFMCINPCLRVRLRMSPGYLISYRDPRPGLVAIVWPAIGAALSERLPRAVSVNSAITGDKARLRLRQTDQWQAKKPKPVPCSPRRRASCGGTHLLRCGDPKPRRRSSPRHPSHGASRLCHAVQTVCHAT